MRRKAPRAGASTAPGNSRFLRRARVALICAEYNPEITHSLQEKCLQGLKEAGVAENRIDSYSVPGCFEIPLLAQKLAARRRHDALIALGAVIQGETLHFELVARECARGVMNVALRHRVPVIFEVLATRNRRDALSRSGNNRRNKGFEAAQAAVAILSVLEQLRD
jgi:6,7-dimethyl-8-ribityllumazine synthase